MPECPVCGYIFNLEDDEEENTVYDNAREALSSLGLTKRDVDKVLETTSKYRDSEYFD